MTFFESWGESGCQKGTENGSRQEGLSWLNRSFSFIADKRHSEAAGGSKNTLRMHNLDILSGSGGFSAPILARSLDLFPCVFFSIVFAYIL